jgi:hypothetical protein
MKQRKPRREELSHGERVERLTRYVDVTATRVQEFEASLLELESRSRLLFRDLGIQQRLVKELEATDGEEPPTLVLDSSENR